MPVRASIAALFFLKISLFPGKNRCRSVRIRAVGPAAGAGGRPARLYANMTAIERKLLTRLDHAAYLGRELARAEQALSSGETYVQDGAPELDFGQKFNGLAMVRRAKYGACQFL